MTIRVRLLALAVGLMASGCGGSSDGTGGTAGGLQGQLADRTFVSETVEGWQLVAGSDVRIGFHVGELSAHAGCNSIDAPYVIKGDKLALQGWSKTDMGCDIALLAQDDWLLGFLTAGPALELLEPRLVMTTADAKMTLLDREIASPDRPLVGTHWMGDGFSDGQAASFWSGITKATVFFDASGSVTVFSACQTGSGSYQVDGSTLTFAGLAYDGAPCADPSDQKTSDTVLLMLDGSPVTFEIEEQRLSIHNGSRQLDFREAN
jgi:heat shock protein HslJ